MPTPPRPQSPDKRPRPPDTCPRPLPDLTAIRLSAVPDCAPPYDDEQPDAGPLRRDGQPPRAGQGRSAAAPVTVTVSMSPTAEDDRGAAVERAGRPVDRPPAANGAAAEKTSTDRSAAHDRREVARRHQTGHPTESGDWPSRYAQVLAETLAGARPASQATPWTTQRARERIRRLGPLLAAEQRPRVRRLIATHPADDVVEVAAVLGFGPRTRAMAARFERVAARPATPGLPARPARWLCTDVESA